MHLIDAGVDDDAFALPDFYRTLIKIQLTLQYIIRATKQCEKNPLMVNKKPMR